MKVSMVKGCPDRKTCWRSPMFRLRDLMAKLWRGDSYREQMAITFKYHGPQGSRWRGKGKPDKKRNPHRVAITLSWSTHTHYNGSFYHGCDVNSMEIEECIFGDNLHKRVCLLRLQVFLIFCNNNWTAAGTFSRTSKLY